MIKDTTSDMGKEENYYYMHRKYPMCIPFGVLI